MNAGPLGDRNPYRPLTAKQLEETQELALRNRKALRESIHPLAELAFLLVFTGGTLVWLWWVWTLACWIAGLALS